MKRYMGSIILLSVLVLLAQSALCSPLRIGSITQGLRAPMGAALDGEGNLYVTDPPSNLVKKFDGQGHPLGSFSVPYPTGIAVGANGQIYVCSANNDPRLGANNAVLIYSAGFASLGALGSGQGEFSSPAYLEIDGDGNVYVADQYQHVVKVFTAGGSPVTTFGGLGNGSGMFNKPNGIAINGTNGEIYVSDRPDVVDSNGVGVGARVQVFSRSGAYLRTLGQFGMSAGQLWWPADLAVDSIGRLYVSDSRQVLVMDPADGAFGGEISAPYAMDYAGIAISRNRILYAAVQRGEGRTGRIDLYGLDGYVTMEAAPSSIAFEARQFGGDPPAQTVNITNSGSGTLNWTASADEGWIVLGQAAGSAGPGGTSPLALGVNIASLTAGVRTGKVTVVSDHGQTVTVAVSLTVHDPVVMNISSGWLNFSPRRGGAAEPQIVTVGFTGVTTPITWSASAGAPWLSVSPVSGTVSAGGAPAALTVSVNTTGMAAGPLSPDGIITITAPGAVGSGSAITVKATVLPLNRLSVTTNRPDAAFTLRGPATYSGTGVSWSRDDAPAGSYTIVFDTVPGHRKPAAQTRSLAEDGEASFSGTYRSFAELAERKNIVVARGPGVKNDAQIKAFRNTGAAVPFDLAALESAYGANVAAGDVDGDGTAELIVGSGDGPNVPAAVRVFRADRTRLAEFAPFGGMHGVHVAAGDLDGDGQDEVIAAPAGGEENTALVAVYSFSRETGRMEPTGLSFTAHAARFGANVATADIDGSGRRAILTTPGCARQNHGVVRVWTAAVSDTNVWSAAMTAEFPLEGEYCATVAAADTDGDGRDEIVVGTGGAAGTAHIRIIDPSVQDTGAVTFTVSGMGRVNVAAADLDGDGRADIIAGPGHDPGASGNANGSKAGVRKDKDHATVQIYSARGDMLFAIEPFSDGKYGISVAVGDLGL